MIALNVSPTAGNLGVFVCICVGGWVSVGGGRGVVVGVVVVVILASFDSFSPLYNRPV